MYEGPVPLIRIDKTSATTASRAERPERVRQGEVPMPGGWIQRYMKLTEFLGSVLGPDYEVVLHDLGDADKSIIAIANGHVSGRTIGAPLTSVALQSIINHSYETQDYRLNYVGVAGTKLLRSSTFFVKDEEGRLVGMLCINFDDSRYRELSDRILKLRHPDVFVETNFAYNEEAAAVRAAPPPTEVSENFPNSLTELTDHLLDEELQSREASGERLSHRDKLALVGILNDKGIFMMKGAVKYVADKLGCSQTTIYRYLNRMNGGSESSSEA
jgi:predicted transcriptional regulator YheO